MTGRRSPKNPAPPRDWDLFVCAKHGVMLMTLPGEHHSTWCPCCELGIEGKPREPVPGIGPSNPVRDDEFRNRIEQATMARLVPLMRAYLADVKEGPLWIGVASWPKGEPLPSGYNEVERYFNVVCYTFKPQHKVVMNEDNAQKTIRTLEPKYGGK